MRSGERGDNMLPGKAQFNVRSFLSILPSLSTSFMDLIPGTLLVVMSPFFMKYPYLLLIYPQLLSFRGSTLGIVVGRHATSLHLGTIKPSLRNNTTTFYTLIFTSFILLIVGSFFVSFFSYIWLYFLYHSTISFFFIFPYIVSIVFISKLVSLPINLSIINFSFSKGLDPDVVAYPFSSTIGDIAITIVFILITATYYNYDAIFIIYIGLLSALLMPLILYKLVDKELFKKEFAESILSMFLVSIIVGFTGNIFKGLEDFLENNPLTYVIYPSFLTLSGDAASIVGSKTSTRLALGGIEKSFSRIYPKEIFDVLMGGLVILSGMVIYSALVTNIVNIFSLLIIVAGLISIAILSLFSLLIGLLTYERGLDPDHFINPLSSVTADMVATLILALVILTI